MSNLLHLNEPISDAVLAATLNELMTQDGFMLKCIKAPSGLSYVASIGDIAGFGVSLQETLANLAVRYLNRSVQAPAVDPEIAARKNRAVAAIERLGAEITEVIEAMADRFDVWLNYNSAQELLDLIEDADQDLSQLKNLCSQLQVLETQV